METKPVIDDLMDCMASALPDARSIRSLVMQMAEGWLDSEQMPAAVQHPLGFLYMPLWKADGTALRLHLWSELGQRPAPLTSPYHRHAWSLVSHVLAGSVTNELPSVVCQHAGADFRLYDICGDGGVDVITPTNITVKRNDARRDTYAQGQTYTTDAGEFHATTSPDGGFAATLCLVRAVAGCTEVTLGPLEETVIEQRREPASSEAVSRGLRTLLEALRNDGEYARDQL
ncbi:MAG: hypothetical protein HOV77_34040 [Hamadaea sp.]|uniref:hypothetical protein n=1 Tax=Hamadaea sp. TaxID=2024425 RepID=UPI0018022F3C|nr:hypothetical protein [Hamadaea sp.]NUT24203.1 hypothetical protein [Hamadaea sp.]